MFIYIASHADCDAKIRYGTNHSINLEATWKSIATVGFRQCGNPVIIGGRGRKPTHSTNRDKPPTVFSFLPKTSATSFSEISLRPSATLSLQQTNDGTNWPLRSRQKCLWALPRCGEKIKDSRLVDVLKRNL